jgi:hypothetical protein
MKTNATEREIYTLSDSELDLVSGGMKDEIIRIDLPNIGMQICCTPDGAHSWVGWDVVLH